MSDFWTIYEHEIRERFRLENTLVNSEAHRELIDFEILVGNVLLRPRKIKVEINAKNNEDATNDQNFCKKCNEEFKTKLSHMIEKHPNHCPYCPRTYTDIYSISRHIGEKHHTLYKDFLEARKMRTNRAAEENLKKHACKICHKQFRCLSDVRKHEPTHSKFKEKLFACKICKKRYTTLYYVLEHTKEFHGSIKYNCKFCSFQTVRPYKLRMHEKKMHVNFPN